MTPPPTAAPRMVDEVVASADADETGAICGEVVEGAVVDGCGDGA